MALTGRGVTGPNQPHPRLQLLPSPAWFHWLGHPSEFCNNGCNSAIGRCQPNALRLLDVLNERQLPGSTPDELDG